MQVIRAVAGAALLGACVVPTTPSFTSSPTSPSSPSTRPTSATALPDGLAGKLCDREGVDFLHNEYGYDGPCWDPPGYRIAALMPGAAVRGRRQVTPGGNDDEVEAWWFEMPEGEVNPNTNCVSLPGAQTKFTEPYEPYEDGGFTPFVVEDLRGAPIEDALGWIDALDQPACVTVAWDPSCDRGHGKVCSQSAYPGDPVPPDGALRLVVGADVIDAGTPDEQRRLPEMVDRSLDAVVAELAQLGFTEVEVVEHDVPCERGVVCEALPDAGQFHGLREPIQLIVRPR